ERVARALLLALRPEVSEDLVAAHTALALGAEERQQRDPPPRGARGRERLAVPLDGEATKRPELEHGSPRKLCVIAVSTSRAIVASKTSAAISRLPRTTPILTGTSSRATP